MEPKFLRKIILENLEKILKEEERIPEPIQSRELGLYLADRARNDKKFREKLLSLIVLDVAQITAFAKELYGRPNMDVSSEDIGNISQAIMFAKEQAKMVSDLDVPHTPTPDPVRTEEPTATLKQIPKFGLGVTETYGKKCPTAQTIQNAATQEIDQLLSTIIEPNSKKANAVERLKGRLKDGRMGQTTLGLMLAVTPTSVLDPKVYTLNRKGYARACGIDQETLNKILGNIKSPGMFARAINIVSPSDTIAEAKSGEDLQRKRANKKLLESIKHILKDL